MCWRRRLCPVRNRNIMVCWLRVIPWMGSLGSLSGWSLFHFRAIAALTWAEILLWQPVALSDGKDGHCLGWIVVFFPLASLSSSIGTRWCHAFYELHRTPSGYKRGAMSWLNFFSLSSMSSSIGTRLYQAFYELNRARQAIKSKEGDQHPFFSDPYNSLQIMFPVDLLTKPVPKRRRHGIAREQGYLPY